MHYQNCFKQLKPFQQFAVVCFFPLFVHSQVVLLKIWPIYPQQVSSNISIKFVTASAAEMQRNAVIRQRPPGNNMDAIAVTTVCDRGPQQHPMREDWVQVHMY